MKRNRMENAVVRILSLSLVSLPLAGCALYKNPGSCEAQMRSELAKLSPDDRLKVSNVGVGIGGSRVVIEGSLEPRRAASASLAVAAASGALAASAVSAAPAPMAVSAVSDALAVPTGSGVSAVSTSAASAASAVPRTLPRAARPAAAECTFDGETLTGARWLRPAELATQAEEQMDPPAQQ